MSENEVNLSNTAASEKYVTAVYDIMDDLLLERNEEYLEKKKSEKEISQRENLLATKGKNIFFLAVKRVSPRKKDNLEILENVERAMKKSNVNKGGYDGITDLNSMIEEQLCATHKLRRENPNFTNKSYKFRGRSDKKIASNCKMPDANQMYN